MSAHQSLLGLAAALIASSLACTPAKAPEGRFVEVRRSLPPWPTSTFGVVDEPELEGFTPSTEEEKKNTPVTPKLAGLVPPGSRRVVTLVLLDADGEEVARFPHVDDTGSVLVLSQYVVVPTVGPRGEKLSQRYLPRRNGVYAPDGPPVPRITRYYVSEDRLALTTPVVGSPEGLVLPFDPSTGQPMRLPTGVRGVKVITRGDREWAAFLVASEGGWYVSTEWRHIVDDPRVRWRRVEERAVADGSVLVGEREGGACDVVTVQPTGGNTERPGLPPMTSCEIAFAAVTGKLAGIADAAAEALRAGEAQRSAAAANAGAELLARSNAEAKRKYLERVAAKDYGAACRFGEQMSAAFYADLVIARMDAKDYSRIESECAQRTITMGEPHTRLWAALEAHGYAVGKAEASEPRPAGPAPASTPATQPSYDARLKRMLDYVYGSGKGSVCPFVDRTYCR